MAVIYHSYSVLSVCYGVLSGCQGVVVPLVVTKMFGDVARVLL